MKVEDAFRELRRRWFNRVLASHPHERECEEEADRMERESLNRTLKGTYDAQTEAIIRGDDHEISPQCANDLVKVRRRA